MNAEERKRAKEAYLASLEKQRAESAAGSAVQLSQLSSQQDAGGSAPPSQRDRKWEERREKFLQKVQQPSSYSEAPQPVNLKAWRAEGYPSEYAYAQAQGVLENNPNKQRSEPPQQQQPQQPQQQPLPQPQQRVEFQQQPQLQRQEQWNAAPLPVDINAGALPVERRDRERQAQYAQQLDQQMLERRNMPRDAEGDFQPPGGGGLRGLSEGDAAGAEAQRRERVRQMQYAQQLEQQMHEKQNKPTSKDGVQLPGGGGLRGLGAGDNLGIDAQRQERARQAQYARELEQQMQERQNKPTSADQYQMPGGGALRGLGAGDDGVAVNDGGQRRDRERQAQYARELEQQMLDRQNKPTSADGFQLPGGGGLRGLGMGDDAAAKAQRQNRDKQAQYAQELEQQIFERQNKPTSSDGYQIPGGGGLLGLGAGDNSSNSSDAAHRNNRNKQAQYARQLEQQMYEQQNKPKSKDGVQLPGGGGLRGLGEGDAVIGSSRRQKQAQYARELEQQLLMQPRKGRQAGVEDGGGLVGFGDEGLNIVNARKQKGQDYAQQLQMQMESKRQQIAMERAQDRASGLNSDRSQVAEPGSHDLTSRREQHNDYSRFLLQQQLHQQSASAAAPGPGPGPGPASRLQIQQHSGAGGGATLQGIGGYEDEVKAAKRAKQAEYAQALQQQQLWQQQIEAQKLASKVSALEVETSVEGDGPGARKKKIPDGWIMGPLGLPVRKTLEVGSRLAQKAYNQNSSPSKANILMGARPVPGVPPQWQAPSQPSISMPMAGYGQYAQDPYEQMYQQQQQQRQQLYQQPFLPPHYQNGAQPQFSHMPQPPQHFAPTNDGYSRYEPEVPLSILPPPKAQGLMHAGAPYMPTGIGGLPWQVPVSEQNNAEELQDERNLVARARQMDQARALEDQIRANKARLDAERRLREDEEARELARLDKERAELAVEFEREKAQQRLKAEEEAKQALQQQIIEKKRQKLEEEQKEQLLAAKEEERVRREQAEVRRREMEELRLEAMAPDNKKPQADISPYKLNSMPKSPRRSPHNSPRLSPAKQKSPKTSPVQSPRGGQNSTSSLFSAPSNSELSAHGRTASTGQLPASLFSQDGSERDDIYTRAPGQGQGQGQTHSHGHNHGLGHAPSYDHGHASDYGGEQSDDAFVMHLQEEAVRAQQEAEEARRELRELRRAYAETQSARAGHNNYPHQQPSQQQQQLTQQSRRPPSFASEPVPSYQPPPAAAAPASIAADSFSGSRSASAAAELRSVKALNNPSTGAGWNDRRLDAIDDEANRLDRMSLDRTMKSESRFVFPDGTAFLPRQSQDGPRLKQSSNLAPLKEKLRMSAALSNSNDSIQITKLDTSKIVDNFEADDDGLLPGGKKDLLPATELEGIIRKNQRKWDLLKRFDTANANVKGESLDLLMGTLGGVNSRPSTAGSSTPMSSRPHSVQVDPYSGLGSAGKPHLANGGYGQQYSQRGQQPSRPRSALAIGAGAKAVINYGNSSHHNNNNNYDDGYLEYYPSSSRPGSAVRPGTSYTDYGL